MGKIHDALKKAEEEREERRRAKREARIPGSDSTAPGATTTQTKRPAPPPPSDTEATRVSPVEPAAAPPEAPERDELETLGDELGVLEDVGTPRTVRKMQHLATVEAPEEATENIVVQPKKDRGIAAGLNRAVVEDRTRFDESLVAWHDPGDGRVEQFRAIKTNLQALKTPPRVFALTSAVPGEGKSITASNLAVVLAEETTDKILLVDANMRRRDRSNLFGLPPEHPGLSDVLRGRCGPMDIVREAGIPNVYYASTGSAVENPGALIGNAAMKEALATWRDAFDIVMLDAPPIIGVNDAAVIGPLLDGVIVVVKLSGTPRKMTEKAVETMVGAGVNVVGCILTHSSAETRPYDLER